MRESKFINQNKEKWQRMEDGIKGNRLAPEDMEKAFVELNDDLAYAKTFYPNRAVRLFLNNLLAPVYQKIYKSNNKSGLKIRQLLGETIPLYLYQARYVLLLAFATVFLGFLIGFFSTRFDLSFASSILGSDYVRITESNISKGNPMGIYKSQDSWQMFQYIVLNNLKVAMYFFMFGALLCIGSLYLLVLNGIVLGAFTFLFTSRGLTTEYLLTVYQHGTLEILSMVVEGGAGLIMGAGFLFPGTKSRLQSIRDAGKKSIAILLVCVPIIIAAAFTESFITRETGMPVFMRTTVILLSLLFMIGYFVLYPFFKFRGSIETTQSVESSPLPILKAAAGEIYSPAHAFSLTLDFFKRNAAVFLLIGMVSVLLFFPFVDYFSSHAILQALHTRLVDWQTAQSAIASGFSGSDSNQHILYLALRTIWYPVYASGFYFSGAISNYIPIVNSVTIFGVAFFVLAKNRQYLGTCCRGSIGLGKIIFSALLFSILFTCIHILFGNFWWLMDLFFFPHIAFGITLFLLHPSWNPFIIVLGPLKYIFTYFRKIITACFSIFALYFFILLGILFITKLTLETTSQLHQVTLFSEITMLFFARFNYFILPLLVGFGIVLFLFLTTSFYELKNGIYLDSKIQSFSFKKEVYGIETE